MGIKHRVQRLRPETLLCENISVLHEHQVANSQAKPASSIVHAS